MTDHFVEFERKNVFFKCKAQSTVLLCKALPKKQNKKKLHPPIAFKVFSSFLN